MGKITVVMTPLELDFRSGESDPMPFIDPADMAQRTKNAIDKTLDKHTGDQISNIELIEGICNEDPEFVFLSGIMHVAKFLKDHDSALRMQIMAHELKKRLKGGQ